MKNIVTLFVLTSALGLFAQDHYSVKDIFIEENIAYTLADSLPLNGKVISNYNIGQLKSEKHYLDGKLDGLCRSWYWTGHKEYERIYDVIALKNQNYNMRTTFKNKAQIKVRKQWKVREKVEHSIWQNSGKVFWDLRVEGDVKVSPAPRVAAYQQATQKVKVRSYLALAFLMPTD